MKNKRKKEQMPFPKILSQLLKDKKITIAQAAKSCGVAPSTIADWKDGASPTDYLAVQKLARFLGVSFSYILTGTDEVKASNQLNVTDFFEDGGEIYDGFAQITIKKLIPKK